MEPHLGTIGRSLCLDGEIAFAIHADGGELQLIPASTVTVLGGPDRRDWIFQLTLPGPSNTITEILPADRVLFLTYAVQKSAPWKGLSPIAQSATTKALLQNLDLRLAEEVGAGVGSVIAVPNAKTTTVLQRELRALAGKLALVQTTQSGYGAGAGASPRRDFESQRIGGNPPVSSVQLRRQTEESILAAAGVPPSVLGGGSEAGSKEALRTFVYAVLGSDHARLGQGHIRTL